jgi:hypothetical protein
MPPNSEVFYNSLYLNSKRVAEEITLVLKIALFCTSESPLDRPSMARSDIHVDHCSGLLL